ncbi:MAG: quinone-dependent dihydroorotate dehydrogenase [Flavobacteriales bacterium]|nr:quinone-dependent dihydroorotate dehydrogenase [Flavobacteriales bacterium]
MLYRSLIRPLLFLFPTERVHYMTMNALNVLQGFPPTRWILRGLFSTRKAEDAKEVFGLEFPNRVGLAAGFDKDARYMHALRSLGFGFIEVGTVTPRPQAGNPKPRLFRLKKDEALINRMGFNNRGLEAMVENLKKRPKDVIIGGNIGKNKDTSNEQAVEDYVTCFHGLHPHVDYFVVNVSSPNTPGLRKLQEKGPLLEILNRMYREAGQYEVQRPILLKIAPDLTDTQVDDIVEIVVESGIDGVIATNTTISRDGLQTPVTAIDSIGNGGLSGRPLNQRATEVVRYLSDRAEGRFKVIGVGGIHDVRTAQEKLDAGAALIQVYSAFIFEGPALISRIIRGIRTAP